MALGQTLSSQEAQHCFTERVRAQAMLRIVDSGSPLESFVSSQRRIHGCVCVGGGGGVLWLNWNTPVEISGPAPGSNVTGFDVASKSLKKSEYLLLPLVWD